MKIRCTKNEYKDQNTIWNILMFIHTLSITNGEINGLISIQNKCADDTSN